MKTKKCYFILLIIALLMIIPLISSNYPSGHDTLYHFANIECIKNMFLSFKFSKISSYEILRGFGYGGSIFYPKLPHIITAIFSIFIGTIKSMKLVNLLTILLSGIFMFQLLNRLFKNNNASLYGSILYMTTPYLINDIYIRGAYNESFIFMFMPMIFISLIDLLDNNKKFFYLYFIVGYYGMINSHLVLSVYFTFFVACFIIFNFKKYFKIEYIRSFIIASIVLLLLCSPDLTLMIQHKRLGVYCVFEPEIMGAIPESVKSLAVSIKEMLLPVQKQYYKLFFFFNIITIFSFILGIIRIFFDKKIENRLIYLIITIFVFLSLFMCTNKFPYEYLPSILLSIQFAYRNVTFLSFFIIIICTLAFDKLKIKNVNYFLLIFIVISCGLPIYYENGSNLSDSSWFYSYDEYAGMGAQLEYLPKNSKYNIEYFKERNNDILVLNNKKEDIIIKVINDNTPILEFEINNENNQKIELEIPRIYYLGYEIIFTDKNNNKERVNYKLNSNGFISLSNYESGTYDVKYKGTNLYKVLNTIRFIMIIVVLLIFIKNNRKEIVEFVNKYFIILKEKFIAKTNKINKKMKKVFNDKNYKKLINIYRIIYDSSLFLLILMSIVLIFTTLLFFVNINISKYHLPCVFIISSLCFALLRKNNVKNAIISIFIGIMVLIVSTYTISKIYDPTADGNTYHKLAVGALKNGWNPIYESVGDFGVKKGNPFEIYDDNVNIKWVDHYAKGTEIFGAVIYAFTNNIESGKVYNLLWIYIGFFIIMNLLIKIGINRWKSFLLAFVLAFNPIILVQIVNYYLDGVLAITLFIIILYSLFKQIEQDRESTIENYIIIGLCLIWCINSKFTGLAFAGVFCGIIWIYQNITNYIYNKNMFKKFIIKDTMFYIITVFVSVVIVGNNSYLINTINNGNPLYPLYGKGHVDNMVLMEMPKSMQNYNNLEIFLTSIFSKGENSSPSYSNVGNEPDLKIPFTISKEEIKNYSIPDIRIGGFGPLYSGIIVLSFIGYVYMIYSLIKKREWKILIPLIIIVVTTMSLILLLDGSYWARYIPYFYLIPMYLLMYCLKDELCEKKLKNIFAYVVIFILILNSALITVSQFVSTKNSNSYIVSRLNSFKEYSNNYETSLKIKLAHHGIQGVQYNLEDLDIDNYILTDDNIIGDDVYMFIYEKE